MKKKFNDLSLASIPAVFLSLFPVFTCSVCAAAFVGFLSSVGLGFTLNSAVMFPLLIVLLGISLWGFWANIKHVGSYQIFAQGAFGALFIVLGQFYLTYAPILYIGVAYLIWASYLNIKVRKACKLKLEGEAKEEIKMPPLNIKDKLLFAFCFTVVILVSIILREYYGFGEHPIHTPGEMMYKTMPMMHK